MGEAEEAHLPQPEHILIDALNAMSDALLHVSIGASTDRDRLASAALLLKRLDESGYVLIADPRKVGR